MASTPPPRKEWAYLTSTFSNQKQDRRNLRVALRSQNGRKFPSLFVVPVAMAMGSHSSLNLRIWNPWISYWRRLWTWKSQTLVQARRKPTDATDTTRKKHGRKKTRLIFLGLGEGVAGNDVFKTSEFFFGRWMIPFLHRIHGRTVNILVHTFPFTIQMLSILLEPTVIYMVITSTCRINMDILWYVFLCRKYLVSLYLIITLGIHYGIGWRSILGCDAIQGILLTWWWVRLLAIWSNWLVQPLPETTPLTVNG